jgi:hypothetical protein
MTDAERIDRLEGEIARLKDAIRELCQHGSAWRPIRFHDAPALDAICRERWPDMGGQPSPLRETAVYTSPERSTE